MSIKSFFGFGNCGEKSSGDIRSDSRNSHRLDATTTLNGILIHTNYDDQFKIVSDHGDFNISKEMLCSAINGRGVSFRISDHVSREVCHLDLDNCMSASNHQLQSETVKASAPPSNSRSDPTMDTPDELLCTICYEVLRDPVMTRCDHLFCRHCIQQWMSQSGQNFCPMDRKPIARNDFLSPPLFLKSLLDRQMIKCDYADVGCQVVVRIDQLEGHLKECPFKPKEEKSKCTIL